MNKKGFTSVVLVIVAVIVMVLGVIGYMVLVKKTPGVTQKTTATSVQTQISSSPTPTPAPNGQQTIKGTLLIYDPSADVSEVHNLGFKPKVWYLVSKDTVWPGSPTSDLELIFESNSICYVPKNQSSVAVESKCSESTIRWGYGDRVSIFGTKKDNTVTVSRMGIFSSLPIEQW